MRNRIILIALAILLLILPGCGIFSPRDADPPEGSSPWFTFPIKWEQTYDDLQYIYLYRLNKQKAADFLSTDFIFHFASQDVTDLGYPSTWNRTAEQNMLNHFHDVMTSQGYKLQITMEPVEDQEDEISSNKVWLYRSYEIKIINAQQQVVETYAGKCRLYMEPVSSLWKIKEWWDYRTNATNTWGKLKYEYSL